MERIVKRMANQQEKTAHGIGQGIEALSLGEICTRKKDKEKSD